MPSLAARRCRARGAAAALRAPPRAAPGRHPAQTRPPAAPGARAARRPARAGPACSPGTVTFPFNNSSRKWTWNQQGRALTASVSLSFLAWRQAAVQALRMSLISPSACMRAVCCATSRRRKRGVCGARRLWNSRLTPEATPHGGSPTA